MISITEAFGERIRKLNALIEIASNLVQVLTQVVEIQLEGFKIAQIQHSNDEIRLLLRSQLFDIEICVNTITESIQSQIIKRY